MPKIVLFIGGTMNSETELYPHAAVGSITFPALDGLPEETYVRIDPPYYQPVRFEYQPTTEGAPA